MQSMIKKLFIGFTASVVFGSGLYAADVTISQTSFNQTKNGSSSIGQSFTATKTGVISKIRIVTDGTYDSQTLTIYAGEGMSGMTLGKEEGINYTDTKDDSGYTFTEITLTTPVPITSGSIYTFEVGKLAVIFTNTNPYDGGQIYSSGNASSGSDLVFEVVQSDPPNAAPTISVGDMSYTEGGITKAIDSSLEDANVTDADGIDDLIGGKLVIQITDGAESTDYLSAAGGDWKVENGSLGYQTIDTSEGMPVPVVTHFATVEDGGDTANDGKTNGDGNITITFTEGLTQDYLTGITKYVRYYSTSKNPITSKTVTFTLTDKNGASTESNSTITIIPINDAPEVNSTAVTTATADTLYSYTLKGTDVDSDDLNWSVVSKPDWLELNTTTAWDEVGSAGFSAGAVSYTSIAFDSSNTPYVVYMDGENSYKATVMKYNDNNSSWEAVGSAGFSAGNTSYTSIAIDSSNTPYVVYQDAENSNKATVMKYNGSSWEAVGSAGFGAGVVYDTSIAFDSSNTPYVVYMDVGNNNKATVMKYNDNNSSWEAVGSAGFSAGTVLYISIAFDSSNTPYVVYQDLTKSNKATVMKYNDDNSSWEAVGSAGFSAGTAAFTSIAFDRNDTPYVVYKDSGNSSKATVMKYNNSSWEAVGSAGFSAGTASYTSIAFDSSNTPYVVYKDYGNSSKATVMKYNDNNSSWEAVGSAGFSAGAADYTSIAFDSSNTPYVVYQDAGNNYKATVMKLSKVKLTGTPTISNGANETENIALVLSDGNLSVDHNFTITVSGLNTAPTISGESNTTVNDTDTNFKPLSVIFITDADDNNVSAKIIMEKASQGTFVKADVLSDDGNGVYSIASNSATNISSYLSNMIFTPTKNMAPHDQVTDVNYILSINDGSVDTNVSLKIGVTSINDAPVVNSDANTSAIEDSVYAYLLDSTDVDGDELNVTATATTKLPDWLSITQGVLPKTILDSGAGGDFGLLDSNKNIIFIGKPDSMNTYVSRVESNGSITNIKYISGYFDEDVDTGEWQNVRDFAIDKDDNVYLSIAYNTGGGYSASNKIWKITPEGDMSVYLQGYLDQYNDGTSPEISDIEIDSQGILYFIVGNKLYKYPSGGSVSEVVLTSLGVPLDQYLSSYDKIFVNSTDDLFMYASQKMFKCDVSTGTTSYVDATISQSYSMIDSSDRIWSYDAKTSKVDTIIAATGTVLTAEADINSQTPTDPMYIVINGELIELFTRTVLSGTPTNDDVGTHDVNLTISDGNLSDTQNFTITVSNTNDAPTTSDISITMNEDGTNTFALNDINFTDDDTASNIPVQDTLDSIYITQLPTTGTLTLNDVNVTLNQKISASDISNLVFTPLADGYGDAYDTFKFVVTDGDVNSTAHTATLNVTNTPDAPVISSMAILTVNEDSNYSYSLTATDVDGDDLNWSVTEGTTLPSWLSLTSGVSAKEIYNLSLSEGTILPEAVIDTKGNVFIIVAGNEGIDLKKIDTQGNVSNFVNLDDYVYSKANPNYDPLYPISPQKIYQNQIMVIDSSDNIYLSSSYASSYDDNNIIYKITPDGVISEYLSDEIVSYMTIDSADTLYFTDNTANFYKVVKAPMWQKESISITGDIIPEMIGEIYTANNNLFVYSNGAILKLDSSNNSFSEFKTNVMMSEFNGVDSNGVIWNESFGELIPVVDLNNADADLTIAALAGKLGFGHMEDGTVKVYEAGTVLSGTPTNDDVGTHDVNLTVSDGNLTATQNFTITVANVNDAPTISDITSSQAIYVNETIKPFSNVTLGDVDNNSNVNANDEINVTISINDTRYGSLSSSSIIAGTIETVQAKLRDIVFTPSKDSVHLNDSADVVFTIIVTDDKNATSSDANTTVTLGNKLLAQTQNEDGAGLIITTIASNAVAENSLTYSVASLDTSIASAYISPDGRIIVTPTKDANGEVTIQVTAEDENSNTTVETFTYKLDSVNDIPFVEDIEDVYTVKSTEDTPMEHTFDISDVDGDNITLSASVLESAIVTNLNVVETTDNEKAKVTYTIPANTTGFTTITITATDENNAIYKEAFNVSIEATDAEKCVSNVKADLTFDDIKNQNTAQNYISSALTLPLTKEGASCGDVANVSWTSSSSEVITVSGTTGEVQSNVIDKTILLTALISKEDVNDTKAFLLTVNNDTVTAKDAADELQFDTIRGKNITRSNILFNLDLVDTSLGIHVDWKSTDEDVINPYSGYVTRPDSQTGDINITLTASIIENSITQSKEFNLTVIADADTLTALDKDKEWLTIGKLLGENKDSNNILTNLVKPLPYEAPNGSTITWGSSNEDVIATSGDVFRSGVEDKYVKLTATIVGDEKTFLLKVLQSSVTIDNGTQFEEIKDENNTISVNFSENNESVTTKANIASFIQSTVEKVISSDSVKAIFDLKDKVMELFLNTDGTTQSQVEAEDKDGNSVLSTIKVNSTKSTTDVSSDGNVTTSVQTQTNSTIAAHLNTDGTVTHKVTTNESNTTLETEVSATIPGSKVEVDDKGNVETSSEILKDGFMIRAIAASDENGKTKTRFEKVNLATGESDVFDNTMSQSTPYSAGNKVEIIDDNGTVYIKTNAPISDNLIVE